MRKNLTLQQQADEILKMAEECGLQGNFFFITTFDRYKTQLSVLDKLKEIIEKDGVLVTKQYVKGSNNLYTNPAVTEYNKTTDSANKTLSTLIRIINAFYVGDSDEEIDPLLNAINGDDGE